MAIESSRAMAHSAERQHVELAAQGAPVATISDESTWTSTTSLVRRATAPDRPAGRCVARNPLEFMVTSGFSQQAGTATRTSPVSATPTVYDLNGRVPGTETVHWLHRRNDRRRAAVHCPLLHGHQQDPGRKRAHHFGTAPAGRVASDQAQTSPKAPAETSVRPGTSSEVLVALTHPGEHQRAAIRPIGTLSQKIQSSQAH
jgi:hypothetical protein